MEKIKGPIHRPRVLVLVGPKGAGKSTIGEMLDKSLGVRFVRVEPAFMSVHDLLGASHPDYERLGFEAVLSLLKTELALRDPVCFESTGASRYFPWLVSQLGQSATVLPVRVSADDTQCLDRIHHRDARIHIPVSDDRILQINRLAMAVDLPWAAAIDNGGPLDPKSIAGLIRAVLEDNP